MTSIKSKNIYRQRLLEAVVFFSQKGKLKYPAKTMIYKVLAEFDFKHFQETGFPVTDQEYEAFHKGPVPQKFHKEITQGENTIFPSDFEEALIIQDESFEIEAGKTRRMFIFKAKRKPNLKIFSPRQQRILHEVAFIYKETKLTDASDASHERGKPWRIAVAKNGEHSLIDLFETIKLKSPLTKETVIEKLKEKEALDYNYGA